MRQFDDLLWKVQQAVKIDKVGTKEIYFTYETPDEVAHIEVYDVATEKTLDSYTGFRLTVEVISEKYPQFFANTI